MLLLCLAALPFAAASLPIPVVLPSPTPTKSALKRQKISAKQAVLTDGHKPAAQNAKGKGKGKGESSSTASSAGSRVPVAE